MNLRSWSLCGALWLAGWVSPGLAAGLQVEVTGIDPAGGQLLVALHQQEASWRSDEDFAAPDFQAYRASIVPLSQPVPAQLTLSFPDLAPGRYALGVTQDINRDQRLNRMLLPFTGMPTEPYGLSNAAWSWFRKGSFSDAAFNLPEVGATLPIVLKTQWQRYIGE